MQALLSPEALARLQPQLERVELKSGQVIYWPDKPITHVYFPINSMVSLLSIMGSGEAVESGVVGRDGMAGLPVFLGATSTYARAVCQVSDGAWRVTVEAFLLTVAGDASLRDRLLRYTQALFHQVAQCSGCNRAHPVLERCARWLLMVQDRVDGESFGLTQEFLSQMLGVRRPSVTVVMGTLQQAGLISYHRGQITVVDRAGLEAAACECYGIITREADRLMRT